MNAFNPSPSYSARLGHVNAEAIGESFFGNPVGRPVPEVPGYTVGPFIGEGGAAEIWQARRDSDGLVAALKVPHNDEECSERLLAEADMLRSLDHPGIVRLIELVKTRAGMPVLAMELIEGRDLSSLVPEGGLSFGKVAELFAVILEAVDHAHSRGIVHRDIKPSNILIGKDWLPKVSDFGLAKSLNRRKDASVLTFSGHIAGTPDYMAPEGFESGTRAGISADIYALGIMFYELLTGRLPRGAWKPLSEVGRLDTRLDSLMAQAIAPDPAQRLKSVETFRRQLAHIRTSRPRYSGSSLTTWRVRAADMLWTVAGLYGAVAGYCSLRRLNGETAPALFDLTMGHSGLLGGFLCAWLLCLLLGSLWFWQAFRLWFFRKVPMREALPCFFGIRLTSGMGASFLAGLAQFLCLWAGFFLLTTVFFKSNHWLTAQTPFWQQALCVTAKDSMTPVSPWTWHPSRFFDWTGYLIREVQQSVKRDSLIVQESKGFLIFSGPLSLALGAAGILAGMTMTSGAAFLEWRQRRRMAVVLPAVLLLGGLGYVWLEFRTQTANRALTEKGEGFSSQSRNQEIIRRNEADWRELVYSAYGREGSKPRLEELGKSLFGPYVKKSDTIITNANLVEALVQARETSEDEKQTVEKYGIKFDPGDYFQLSLHFEHYADTYYKQSEKKTMATGVHLIIKWRGTLREDALRMVFRDWDFEGVRLYMEPPPAREPSPDYPEFMQWIQKFLKELGRPGCPDLDLYLLKVMLTTDSGIPGASRCAKREEILEVLRQERVLDGGQPMKFQLEDPPAVRKLTGGRWEVTLRVERGIPQPEGEEPPTPMTLRMEVIPLPVQNTWKILRLDGI